YRILDRNLKVSGREVDVIALDGEILAFVEVKTRSGGALVHPLLAVDGKRQARLRQAARFYAAQKKLREVSIRFDVVTLDFSQAADGRAELIKNAF
ncbi:MAG: YraN family protein, partial [Nitrospinota bacterium]|nr:YraN family protein [Nitrospinota bacterium]